MTTNHAINDEYVIIFRYKTHGFRFELLCRRQETDPLLTEDGRLLISSVDDDRVLARILYKPTVYSNAKRKEISTKSSLATAFGASSTVREMIITILTRGEVVETQRDREIAKNSAEARKAEILSCLPSMLLNLFSGVNPSSFEIEEAIGSVIGRWKPSVFGVPLVVEAGYVASQIAHKIDCVRVLKKVVFTYNKTKSTSHDIVTWHDFLIGYASVVTSVDSFDVSVPLLAAKASASGEADEVENDGRCLKKEVSPTILVKETLIVDAIVLSHDPTWKRLSSSFALSVEERKISDEEIRKYSDILYDPPNVVCVEWETNETGPAAPVTTSLGEQEIKKKCDIEHDKLNNLAAMVLNRHIEDEEVGDYRAPKGKRATKGASSAQTAKLTKSVDCSDSSSDDGKSKKRRGAQPRSSVTSRYAELEIELQSKTHKTLQEMCKKHGMSTGGKKDDLIDRLLAFESNQ